MLTALRVKARKAAGGHDVPKEKFSADIKKALKLIPSLLELCDVCHIYDNSDKTFPCL